MSKNKLPIATAMPSSTPENKYVAEDALRTLRRADEIRKDRGLMKECKALAKSHSKVVSRKK